VPKSFKAAQKPTQKPARIPKIGIIMMIRPISFFPRHNSKVFCLSNTLIYQTRVWVPLHRRFRPREAFAISRRNAPEVRCIQVAWKAGRVQYQRACAHGPTGIISELISRTGTVLAALAAAASALVLTRGT
jgi:hypothetical protein